MPSIRERMNAFLRPQGNYYAVYPDGSSQVLNMDAQRLYQTQDNLKAVVDFLSNSIAQLPLKVYDRNAEANRTIDRTSVAARTLFRPNADQTAFEFWRGLAIEYFVFGTAFVWVLPDPESESGKQLRLIPHAWVVGSDSGTNYAPDVIRVRSKNGTVIEIPRTEFVQFRTYSAGNPGGFVSPISALKSTLHEQIEASRFRKELWHSSGRLNAQIIRPKDVAPWSEETRKSFIQAFREAWGEGGSKAGSIPLMEDGMEIKPFQTSFKEQQWAESIQLSRQAVCAAYGINPALIWHTGTQTYASAKDNARALYAEGLGPHLQMFQQRTNSFLLPMLEADPLTKYVEFDLTEKLKGSFEERASIIQSAVGGPWMTRNEARADNNMPPVDGGDELIVPLNVVTGGQASPQDTHMNQNSAEVCVKETEPIRFKMEATEEEIDSMSKLFEKFFKRQANAILPKIGSGSGDWWDTARWNRELVEDILQSAIDISKSHGETLSEMLDADYKVEQTIPYMTAMIKARAKLINESTKKKILAKLETRDEWDDDETTTPAHAFKVRESESNIIGEEISGASAWFGTREANTQYRASGGKSEVYKIWVWSGLPNSRHANMSGERVPIDEPFSNGAYWPGDDSLSPDESCGCGCSTQIEVIRR